jgi:hypothetical protein
MSDALRLIKQLAGLQEMEISAMETPADPSMLAGNIKQYAEDLYAIISGGRGNALQMIQQIENGLNALKQTYTSGPR